MKFAAHIDIENMLAHVCTVSQITLATSWGSRAFLEYVREGRTNSRIAVVHFKLVRSRVYDAGSTELRINGSGRQVRVRRTSIVLSNADNSA